jgi:type VI secretion system protein ImpG
MDPRFLQLYNSELQHIRDMGAEFAREFPKIAGRLGMEGIEVADPYVERLIEAFSYLSARVQLKIQAEFPKFTQHLLEIVYPQYLAPTPSMVVVRFEPDLQEGSLVDGYVVPRNTILRSIRAKGDRTACQYRTAHDVTLWPLVLEQVRYYTSAGALATIGVDDLEGVRAGFRFGLRVVGGAAFDQLSLDQVRLAITGSDALPMQVYEQIIGNGVGLIVRPKGGAKQWSRRYSTDAIRRVGFSRKESLLPPGKRTFDGYRLLQEYFAFPQRFLFVEFGGIGDAVKRCAGTELEIIVLLDRTVRSLEKSVSESNFELNCTPAINLFPRRADRIHLDDRHHEYHVVPDRTRPQDFEVHSVNAVQGFGTSADPEQEFLPFYACSDLKKFDGSSAFYTVSREPRMLSSRQRRRGTRSSYVGNEVFLAIVDGKEAPYRSSLRQLGVEILCTNRDLPLHMAIGRGKTDFTLESGAPVLSVQCIAGPTRPRPSHAFGETSWRLISHLSLNYLSLVDNDQVEGAAAIRELLSLYADSKDAAAVKQIEGVKSVASRPVNGRIPTVGPITYGRGVEITVTCDEHAFEGTGVFLLGAVLDEFISKYVSLNSFTRTIIRSSDRGEIIRWPARLGTTHTL